MTRLVLVRHGQSGWNAQRRIQGHSGQGLSDRGRAQAAGTAEWVAATHPDATIVSSDLQRCRETVAPIAARLARDVTFDPALRERSFGRWEGNTAEDCAASDPDLYVAWRDGQDVIDQVGGETGAQLTARVVPALTALALAAAGDTVVVVTHGGPVWHGVHALLDLPFATLGGVGNGAVTELVHDRGRWFCDSWNQTAHLPADLRTSFRPSETRAAATARD